jgi:hypothetical protein
MIRLMILIILLSIWGAMSAWGDGATTPSGPNPDKNTTAETGETGGDASVGTAKVSGKAHRTISTCPDGYGSKGTLYLSLRSDCASATSEVASATVKDAAMHMPEIDKVDFEIPNVADGTWYLYALLDRDGTGCDAVSKGDVYINTCVKVVVVDGQDVSNVVLPLDICNR